MAIPMEVLAAEVLALPVEQRSELLDRLLSSLDSQPLDPAWEQQWSTEVERREGEIASGRAQWLAGDEVLARLRARLQ